MAGVVAAEEQQGGLDTEEPGDPSGLLVEGVRGARIEVQRCSEVFVPRELGGHQGPVPELNGTGRESWPAEGVLAGKVACQHHTVASGVVQGGDARPFVEVALCPVQHLNLLARRVARLDHGVVGHRDAAGVHPGDGLDRGGDDLGQRSFEVVDAAVGVQRVGSGAQCDDERVGLVWVHETVPPSELAVGTQPAARGPCAGQVEPKRHARRSTRRRSEAVGDAHVERDHRVRSPAKDWHPCPRADRAVDPQHRQYSVG